MLEFTRPSSQKFDLQLEPKKEQRKPFGDEVASLLLNAEMLLTNEETDLARVLIYQALSLNSKHPKAIRMAAEILDPSTQGHQIAKIYGKLVEVEDHFVNRLLYANALYKIGSDKEAMTNYQKALSLSPEVGDISSDLVFEVYKNMGTILTRDGDYEGAEEYFYKAFAIRPDSDVLLVNLGTLEFQLGDNQAIERFRQAVEINPLNDKGWVGIGLIHEGLGDTQLALGNIEKALEINPKNRTAVHLYANWSSKIERNHQAIERLQNYLSLVEFDEEMSLLLIHLCCLVNQIPQARAECERILCWNPKSERLGQIYQEVSSIYESTILG